MNEEERRAQERFDRRMNLVRDIIIGVTILGCGLASGLFGDSLGGEPAIDYLFKKAPYTSIEPDYKGR